MSKDPTICVRDILEAIGKIETYIRRVDKGEFTDSTLLQDAVIRRLAIIGEAARNFPQELKDQHPDVPWQRIVGMRNRLIHEYGRVDIELTWEVIQQELPKLKHQLQNILSEIEKI